MQIGSHQLPNQYLLAPMAGITDLPFRQLCTEYGAGLTTSEMTICNCDLQSHPKTLKKANFYNLGIHSVQIVGADPRQMVLAAQLNQDRGATIIDINMGCPAKKVCSHAAGSALLKDEALVAKILESVVKSVDIPVTLKIRTGWDSSHRNAATIARIAENAGIQALTIHGRTRACKFDGVAEYDTIKLVKQSVNIPIIANGDIISAEKAKKVFRHTLADAVMIGRAALGQPWIFSEILHKLNGIAYLPPSTLEIKNTMNRHMEHLYSFYGNYSGVRIARKHIGWYFDHLGGLSLDLKTAINRAVLPEQQLKIVNMSFNFIKTRVA